MWNRKHSKELCGAWGSERREHVVCEAVGVNHFGWCAHPFSALRGEERTRCVSE